MAMNKKSRAAGESIAFLVLVGGILVALNVVGVFAFGRIDLTDSRVFSLSDGSRRLAKSLEDQLEITAYFTADLPPPMNATERYVRDLLREYEAASGGRIRATMVDPSDEETQKRAEEDGVRRVSHQAFENDALNVKEGYRGIVFRYLGEARTIPIVEDTRGLEYRFTQTIKQLIGEKKTIGIVSGHDGPALGADLKSLRAALPNYELKEVSLNEPVPNDYAAVLVISPKKGLSDEEMRQLDAYVLSGGSLGIFGGSRTLDPQTGNGSKVDSRLNTLLSRWGVKLGDDLVADLQSTRAPYRTPSGITVAVPYPPVPVVSFDQEQREHPVLFRIPSAILPFPSSLAIDPPNDPDVKVTALARSSENSWKITEEDVSLTPRHPRDWRVTGATGPFTLIAAIEGKLPTAFPPANMSTGEPAKSSGAERATKPARVLVSSTGMFLEDSFMPPQQEGSEAPMTAALALALNAIDWLAQDADLIAIRAKNVEDPALEIPAAVSEAEQEAMAAAEERNEAGMNEAIERRKEALRSWDAKKSAYRWGNTLGIPIAFALFGVARFQMRRKKKKNLTI